MEQKTTPTTSATANILVNIPVEEWNETRAQIRQICSGIEMLKSKQSQEYLTIDQVCERLKISRGAFYSYKNTGKLKVSKIGKKLFVRQSDLEDAINNGIV